MNSFVITGATGHIGDNLVRLINSVEPDAKIKVLLRRSSPAELDGTVCEEIVGDITDMEFLAANIGSEDIVIHLACLIDMTDNRREETFNVNFGSTKAICGISRSKNVKKFVYVGSVDAIYRDGSEDIISEPDRYFPDKIEGNYGKSKAMASAYVLDCMRQDPGFNAVMVLPSAVIGINDRKPSAAGRIILDSVRGKPEFGIDGGYNFVDVTDVCNVIYRLSLSDFGGQYIISGHNVSVRQIYDYINRHEHLRRRPVILPVPVIRLLLPFIKQLNKVTLRALRESHNYSSERARRDLGYTPQPTEKTFSDTINWFKDNLALFG